MLTRQAIIILILVILAVAMWVTPATRTYRSPGVAFVLGMLAGYLLAQIL